MEALLVGTDPEITALERFRKENAVLFRKNDAKLLLHLSLVMACLAASTFLIPATPSILIKMLAGCVSAFFIFLSSPMPPSAAPATHGPISTTTRDRFMRPMLTIAWERSVTLR